MCSLGKFLLKLSGHLLAAVILIVLSASNFAHLSHAIELRGFGAPLDQQVGFGLLNAFTLHADLRCNHSTIRTTIGVMW